MTPLGLLALFFCTAIIVHVNTLSPELITRQIQKAAGLSELPPRTTYANDYFARFPLRHSLE